MILEVILEPLKYFFTLWDTAVLHMLDNILLNIDGYAVVELFAVGAVLI